METAKSIRRSIVTFLLLTFALSSIFYYLIISAKTLQVGGRFYVLGLMWCPGVAALITQLVYRKNLRGLGWGWGKTKYQLWSYAIPFLYALAAYTFVWATGLGGFYNAEVVGKFAAYLGRPELASQSPFAVIALYTLVLATFGMITSCIFALGEEIGWRGLFVPYLAKTTTFTKTALISGIVWAAWHYPILLFAGYNSGTPAWYALTCFTLMVIGISFIYAWMRLKSGSVWTAMLLHASHNNFIQGIFTPLTTNTGITKYIIDEFGAALAIISVLLGYVFWRKRSEIDTAQLQESAVSEFEVVATKAV